MFQLLCFCVVVLSVNTQYWSSFTKPNERIIYGNVVDISDFPYQVGLVYNEKRIICGGALVKPTVVFTAAHCTHKGEQERENLSILVGANSLDDPNGQLYEIASANKHPDYNGHDYDHDFSVIVLKDPVHLGAKAKSIAITTSDHEGGTTATISGWGRTETGKPSKYLRSTELEVEDWKKCQDLFPSVFHPKITKNMICVKPSRSTTYFGKRLYKMLEDHPVDNQTIGQLPIMILISSHSVVMIGQALVYIEGDSGGPLVINGELYGLVSFGRRIGREKKTTVFTRVKNFLDFVEETVPNFHHLE